MNQAEIQPISGTSARPVSSRRRSRFAVRAALALSLSAAGLAVMPTAEAGTLGGTVNVAPVQANGTTPVSVTLSDTTSSDVVTATISTTVGSLTLGTTTGLMGANNYGFTGSTIAFTGTVASATADLPSLTLTSSSLGDAGSTAVVTLTAFNNGLTLPASGAVVVYSPTNQHFYAYVPNSGVSWTSAKSSADGLTYDGLTGYLASIPSQPVNDLIASHILGAQNIWIGARGDYSNGTYPRIWEWADGPIAGTVISDCNSTAGTCTPATGGYNSWASGEPNNAGGVEDAAVDNYGSVGQWNDLDPTSSVASGYLVEFGSAVNGPTPAGVVAATGNLPVYGVPGQPTSVAASVAGTTATISWTPPGFTGGIPLTGFTVTAQPGGNTCVVSSGSQTACTMPGLVKGTAYTFTVTATNGFLTSPASTASGSVTVPYTPPGTPTGFTAVRGDQDAALSFTAPADTGGVPITGYQVTTNGGTTWQLITTIAGPGGTLQAALTGLTNGTSYQVAVRAVNVIGAGYSTTAVLVTPITGEPGTPGPVTVSGTTTTTASVHWTAPSITGATPITGYQLQITDHTTGTVRTLTLGPILGTVVTGLTPGDHYTFAAAAVNAAGASLFTNPSTTITTPSPSPTPSPTPTPTPTGGTPPPAVSAAQRAHEVPVPADPNAYRGPQRFTTAYGRSFHGTPAFAIPTLHGYQLHRGQAVTFSSAASSAALFTFNSARLTAPARADIRELVVSLTHAHAVVCEGYTDYQVAPGHARTLSAQRARAVCAAVRAADPHLRVTAIGYGGRRPAVIGGSITRRAANRRIVIDITG